MPDVAPTCKSTASCDEGSRVLTAKPRVAMQLFTERRLERLDRAVLSGRIIPYLALVLGAITLIAGLSVRLLARGEFNTLGESVWWAAQTVTTVGYGDVIPETAFAKVIAVFVMLIGVATASITTAIITSAVITANQRRNPRSALDPRLDALQEIRLRLEAVDRIEERLAALERRLDGS